MQREPLMTVRELSELTTIAEETFYFWRTLDRGPKSMKLGRRVVYKRSDVEEWLQHQEETTSRGGVN